MPYLGAQAGVWTRNVVIAAQRSDSLSNALTHSAIPDPRSTSSCNSTQHRSQCYCHVCLGIFRHVVPKMALKFSIWLLERYKNMCSLNHCTRTPMYIYVIPATQVFQCIRGIWTPVFWMGDSEDRSPHVSHLLGPHPLQVISTAGQHLKSL